MLIQDRPPSKGFVQCTHEASGNSNRLQRQSACSRQVFHSASSELHALYAGKSAAHDEQEFPDKEMGSINHTSTSQCAFVSASSSACPHAMEEGKRHSPPGHPAARLQGEGSHATRTPRCVTNGIQKRRQTSHTSRALRPVIAASNAETTSPTQNYSSNNKQPLHSVVPNPVTLDNLTCFVLFTKKELQPHHFRRGEHPWC